MKELSIQQYTFRPWSNQDGLFPVLKDISAMGFTGLEMCCFSGFDGLAMSAKELKLRLADMGMHLIGNHFTREMFTGNHKEAFDYIAEAGGSYAVYNIWGFYDSLDAVMQKADYLNSLSRMAKAAGITLLYHNHAPEFVDMGGKLVIDRLSDALDPDVCFEHDLFFAAQQGCDVYNYLQTNAKRVRAVHLKQISAEGENVDLPDGIIDIARVVSCANGDAEFILEQAAFQKDIPHSLRRNAEFLKAL